MFTQLTWDLKSGDASIDGSAEYADYRKQLVTWDEYARMVPTYAEQVSLPADATSFIAQLKTWLESISGSTDQSFPDNAGVRIENGEPFLTKQPWKDDPAKLRWLEKTIADRLDPVQILDALADTENLLNWCRVALKYGNFVFDAPFWHLKSTLQRWFGTLIWY